MSLSKKGKPANNKGKKMSANWIALLSERSKNQVHTPERRAHMSALRIGNTFGIGNKSRTGMKNSEETKLKISIALKGRKGWKQSEKQKEHLAEAAKKRPRFSCVECKRELQVNALSKHLALHDRQASPALTTKA
jgi:hypothetical protein